MSRVLLTVVLLDVRSFEILRVLNVVERLAQGLEAVGVVRKLRSVSCVDDIPCIHDGVGYLFPVMPTVVVAVWLRPRGLVCLRLATPGVDCSQLPDPLDFSGFAAPVVVDAGGLRGYDLPEV